MLSGGEDWEARSVYRAHDMSVTNRVSATCIGSWAGTAFRLVFFLSDAKRSNAVGTAVVYTVTGPCQLVLGVMRAEEGGGGR